MERLKHKQNNFKLDSVHYRQPDADVCSFCCKKLRAFQNLWCVRTNKEIKFSRFCADVFYGRSLTMI